MSDKILFCLPYAGTSASVYTKWKEFIDSSIRIVPVELAGKGKRFREKQYNTFLDAADDIFNIISSQIEKNNSYALFGHSLGALLIYELYGNIARKSLPLPNHLFISGYTPPHIKPKILYHKMPDDEFIEKIKEIGGTPKEFFDNQELLAMFIPILKEDYRILEQYDYKRKDEKIISDISVFHGIDDEMSFDEIKEWKEYAQNNCVFYTYKGGHFFIHDYTESIVNTINNALII